MRVTAALWGTEARRAPTSAPSEQTASFAAGMVLAEPVASVTPPTARPTAPRAATFATHALHSTAPPATSPAQRTTLPSALVMAHAAVGGTGPASVCAPLATQALTVRTSAQEERRTHARSAERASTRTPATATSVLLECTVKFSAQEQSVASAAVTGDVTLTARARAARDTEGQTVRSCVLAEPTTFAPDTVLATRVQRVPVSQISSKDFSPATLVRRVRKTGLELAATVNARLRSARCVVDTEYARILMLCVIATRANRQDFGKVPRATNANLATTGSIVEACALAVHAYHASITVPVTWATLAVVSVLVRITRRRVIGPCRRVPTV